mmetsp:Transcript_57699/g.130131  ORF Transcript_57699/g.130131 Transcript_57699/m.130131 type:complete len:284 (-) Transcript_57699:8-859(-)
MTTSGCERSELAWSQLTKPPATSSKVIVVCFARLVSMEWHCTASSRVGIKIMAFVATGPVTRRPLASRVRALTVGLWQSLSSTGRRNDAVFPEPVSAVASMSRPRSAGGITSRCTGVGVSKFSSVTARSRGRERRRSEKCMPVFRWVVSTLTFFFFGSSASSLAGSSLNTSSRPASCSRARTRASRLVTGSASWGPVSSTLWLPSKSHCARSAPCSGSSGSSSSSLTSSLNLFTFFPAIWGPASSSLPSASPSLPSTSSVVMRSAMAHGRGACRRWGLSRHGT